MAASKSTLGAARIVFKFVASLLTMAFPSGIALACETKLLANPDNSVFPAIGPASTGTNNKGKTVKSDLKNLIVTII